MRIFETHAHLDFKDYDSDRDSLINECIKNQIEFIINIGVDEKTSLSSIKLSEKYKQVYATVGFHPHDAKNYNEAFVRKTALNKKILAIGEIGLDYYRNLSPAEIQKKAFESQIKIAHELNLPIIVHDRDAHVDCFEILQRNKATNVVFHCFSGDVSFAEKILQAGWFLSFTGTITYKNNSLEDVVRMVPKDKFFIETDSPYLTPVPLRGKRNSPVYLRYIVDKIAEIRKVPPKYVAEQSFENSYNFFFKSDKER